MTVPGRASDTDPPTDPDARTGPITRRRWTAEEDARLKAEYAAARFEPGGIAALAHRMGRERVALWDRARKLDLIEHRVPKGPTVPRECRPPHKPPRLPAPAPEKPPRVDAIEYAWAALNRGVAIPPRLLRDGVLASPSSAVPSLHSPWRGTQKLVFAPRTGEHG